MSASTNLSPAQEDRLRQFGCTRAVDIHCHVLPGLDDGPANPTDTINLCRALVMDGTTDVIATPHQLGRWDGANGSALVREAVAELQSRLTAEKIPLEIHPGGEVRLDERIPQLLGSGHILTLADQGTHLLLELPLGFMPDPSALVPYLTSTGTRIILAHAERYDPFVHDWRLAEAWVARGVAFQVNAASIIPDDDRAQAAWQWMKRGWVSIVASDAHSTGTRRPRMTQAIDRVIGELGLEAARRICIENPLRVLTGQDLISG